MVKTVQFSKEHRQKAIKYGLLTIIVCVVLRLVLFDGPIRAIVFALTQPGGWPDGYRPNIDGVIQMPALLIGAIMVGYPIGYPFAAGGLWLAIRLNVTSRTAAIGMGFLVGLLATALATAIFSLGSGPGGASSTLVMYAGVEVSKDGVNSPLGWWLEAVNTVTFALICSFGTFVMHRVMTAPHQPINKVK